MSNKYEQMLYKNQFHIEFRTTFVFKCQSLEQKQVFVKIVKKWGKRTYGDTWVWNFGDSGRP